VISSILIAIVLRFNHTLICYRILIVTRKHGWDSEPNVLLIASRSSRMNYSVMTVYSNCV